MSDHLSKDHERQETVFPEHLVGEELLMLQHSWLWDVEVFQYKCKTNDDGRIGFGFAFKNNTEKNRDSDNQSGQKKRKKLSNISPQSISLLKYLQVNMSTCLSLKQSILSNISCMWLFAVVQAGLKLFYGVCDASFSRKEFFRCLILVTRNNLCAF